jgi:hypothetical protein
LGRQGHQPRRLPRHGRLGHAALPGLRRRRVRVAAAQPPDPQPRRRHAQHRPRQLDDVRHAPRADRRRPVTW